MRSPLVTKKRLISCIVQRTGIAKAVQFAFLLCIMAGVADGATIDVMSFNIRNASGFGSLVTPPNGWFDLDDFVSGGDLVNGRRLRTLAVIRANDPDLLGVQESVAVQTDDLIGELTQYEYFGVGRDDGDQQGEQNGIFYRADRFDRIRGGHFWLSETPSVPGTTFATSFDSGNPRMATWVVLRDQLTGNPIVVMNTHWSLSTSARRESAELIREQLPEIAGDLPTIIMGDLNTTESSTAFGTLRDGTSPDDVLLVDSYRQANLPSNQERTFHNYNGGTSGSRIDHILHSADDFIAIEATIDRTTYDGLHTSDHYPVTARLQIVTVPEPSIASILCGGLILISRRTRSKR